jgi:hypothetical protein
MEWGKDVVVRCSVFTADDVVRFVSCNHDLLR